MTVGRSVPLRGQAGSTVQAGLHILVRGEVWILNETFLWTPHLSDGSPVQHYLVSTLSQLTVSLSLLLLLSTVSHSPSPPSSHSLHLRVVVAGVVIAGVLLLDRVEAKQVVGAALSLLRLGKQFHRGD